MRVVYSFLLTCCALCAGCIAERAMAEPGKPNFLVLVADDLGVDSFASYGINPRNARTPNIDRLAARGMLFTEFWAQPVCSPTRASVLTGQFSFRHGVSGPVWGYEDEMGIPIPEAPEGSPKELDYGPFGLRERPGPSAKPPLTPPALRPDAFTLPQALKPLGYATAALGKWHLADLGNGWLEHPNIAGFDYFSGPLAGALFSNFAWQHVENGVARQETGYVDQHSVDTALAWIRGVAPGQPWFVWFSLINPHEPFHKPPEDLIRSLELRALDPNGVTDENAPLYFKAQVEAMDSLVGALLDGIPDEMLANTYVIWFGDNGDDRWARSIDERTPNRYKITLYEGGVRVPFVAAGPGVPSGVRNDSMGHAVDLFNTVLELADVPPAEDAVDSLSLAGQLTAQKGALRRNWNFSDIDMGMGRRSSAIRDEAYKLIVTPKAEELYHLPSDAAERKNLLANDATDLGVEARAHYEALKNQLRQLLSQ